MLCPGYEDDLGCKTKSLCIKRAEDRDGNACPAHSVCPMQCTATEMLCSDGFDHTGCKNADRCLPRGSDTDGNLCPGQCPVVCDDETQVFCPERVMDNGCKDAGICIAKLIGNDGAQCKPNCPISCLPTEIIVPGGVDANGCPGDETCGGKSFPIT